MESNIAVAALEILIIVGIIAGLIFFLDRKQSARIDRLEKRLDDQGKELRAAIDDQGREFRTALDDQGKELQAAIDDQGKELRAAIDDQGREFRTAIDDQGRELRAAIDDQGKELRAAIDDRGKEISILNTKVDRAQTTLDILVFGNPVVPPPVARSRAQSEGEVEEAAVGD